MIRAGQGRFLLAEIWMRLYKKVQELLFFVRFRIAGKSPGPPQIRIQVQTKHPIAFESPDHLVPWGTMNDNSTNKKFVLSMVARLHRECPGIRHGLLDLGCSGGQLVRDFSEMGWLAVGLEGSDYSLKHKRANWPALGGRNLFTCDITKPFQIYADDKLAGFHLVTAWEVFEHIAPTQLPGLFHNIMTHLQPGGYLVASTTSAPDVHDGIDLHQTKWTNQEWGRMIAAEYPELERADLGLQFYQYVRHNEERSFLVYRRKIQM
jgi:2-polyprenyl-3-methyl-5-hydroxy-6-metoxy-1,4-benzoquinol methylase